MKENTQKLLVWLYRSSESGLVGYEQLSLLFPDYTAGGRRSLIHYLQEQHLLKTDRHGQKTGFSLTTHGREAVESLFPALSERYRETINSGLNWYAIIFLQAPKGDQHFRYLRRQLVDNHSLALSRGVYLYPGPLPGWLQADLHNRYIGAVQVLTVKKWQFGDEQATVDSYYKLSDLVEILSGLSSEIEKLLMIKSEQNSLTNKNKQQLFSVFDRLFEVIKDDPGFSDYYFPQTPSSFSLLKRLQGIIK